MSNKGMQGTEDYALPLVIAVTGHRELLEAEVGRIQDRVRTLLQELAEAYPSRKICIMSPLAEGADSLVAEIAIELSLDLIVPLPKPVDAYLDDFRSDAARLRFKELSNKAADIFELPIELPRCPEGIEPTLWEADYPYAQLGTYLSSHCHILLALWDGNSTQHLGGTAQVVKFHQDNVMPGITRKTVNSQQMLIDDENDLVFHLVCTHGKGRAQPLPNLTPLDWYWSSKDTINPVSKQMPTQHLPIFHRAAEFSADAQRLAPEIVAYGQTLITEKAAANDSPGIEDIDKYFRIADYLAIFFQRRTIRALRATHVLAFLMGLTFILFSDLNPSRAFLIAFIGFFGIASLTQWAAKRGAWHRKYLDYRTLAEGLRVQFYWTSAAVARENRWTFTHDTFLQAQDPEIGWIRDVMRVAGARSDAEVTENPAALQHTIEQWIGDSESGQLGYYSRMTRERIKRRAMTRWFGTTSLLGSVVIVLLFLLIGSSLTEATSNLLMVTMGTLLLLYAIREGYTYATADKELIKQYEFMKQVFENAHRRLQMAADDIEKRQILYALGQTALNENADWILMHRERSVEQGEIWRMGS